MKGIYLGKNTASRDRFASFFGENFFASSNRQDFRKLVSNPSLSAQKIVIIIDRDVMEEVSRVKHWKKSVPNPVLVFLLSEGLSREEMMAYIRMGVDNVIAPSITDDYFQTLIRIGFSMPKETGRGDPSSVEFTAFQLPRWKRIFDIVFASFALLVLSPFLLLVAVAIRIESKGPVVYRSRRVGSNYRFFDFYKFRSMYIDADKRLKEFESKNKYGTTQEAADAKAFVALHKSNAATMLIGDDYKLSEFEYVSLRNRKQHQAFVKLLGDPRITKVGRLLRKFSIDELPQLINILQGDMCIVGNRPLPPYEAELLTTDGDIERFMAPAGLTGLWQVEKRGDEGALSPEERKQLDVKYARSFSFWLDIKIILKTFVAFIQKDNV